MNITHMKNENKWMLAASIILACGACAAAYFLIKKQQERSDKPPKNAPQLDIDNPGTQADFPTSATESEVG